MYVGIYSLDLVPLLQDDSLLKGKIQLIEVGANSMLGYEGDLVRLCACVCVCVCVCTCV